MIRIRKVPGPKPDPHPEIPAAGQALHLDKANAKGCLDWNHTTPYQKRSLLEPIQHLPGKVAPNVAAVSEKARKLTHGVRGAYKYSAADVLSPPKLHPLLQDMESKRERIYHRREHQVLGAAVPNATKLPEFTLDPEFMFGISTKEDDDVRVIMYPKPKPEDDTEKVKRQYILSHNLYSPGEQKKRYGDDWTVPEDKVKSQTREDSNGKRVQDALYWDDHRQRELKSKIISKRLADYRERRQVELGTVHDPMKDTMAHLPADYTFGIKYTPDEYSVGHLIGSGKKITRQKYIPTKAAGIPTRHGHSEDDVRPHVRKIQEGEDTSLGFKITEDVPGGELNKKMLKSFQLNHIFGVPTVKGPRAYPVAKRLADTANYGDELSAKALIYPTPLNIYGRDQLRALEKKMASVAL